MPKSKAPLTNTLAHFLDQEPGQELENARQLPIDQIAVNPEQSRQQFDEAALDELRRSIEQHGILEPLLVRPVGAEFVIIAGERRYRAAMAAGLSYVPVIIHRDLDEDEAAILTALENLQREDLDIEDEARQFARLLKITGLSQRKLADLLGIGFNYLSERVRLLDRTDLIARYRSGEITLRQAMRLVRGEAEAAVLYSGNTGAETGQMSENDSTLYSGNTGTETGQTSENDSTLYSGKTETVLVNGQPMTVEVTSRVRTPRADLPPLDRGSAALRPVQRFSRYVQGIQPLAVPVESREALRQQLSEAITMAQAALRALEQAEKQG